MPRYQHPHDQTPPAPPDVCELAIYPVAVVPYAIGALESRVYKYSWSDAGYLRGVQLIRSLQMALLCGGLTEITDRQDALYRMLDSALFGRLYTVVSTDPLDVTPAIAPTHDLEIEANDSLLGRTDDLQQLLKNALNGTLTTNYFTPVGIRELLQQIADANATENTLDAEQIEKLVELLVLLA